MTTRQPNYNFSLQLKALVIKSATNQMREYASNLGQLSFPVLLLIALFALQLLLTDLWQDAFGPTIPEVRTPALDFRFLLVANQESEDSCPDPVQLRALLGIDMLYSSYGQNLGVYAGIDPLIADFVDYPVTYLSPYVDPKQGLAGEMLNLPENSTVFDASSALSERIVLKALDRGDYIEYCFDSSFILTPDLVEVSEKADIDARLLDVWGTPEQYITAYDFKTADRDTAEYSIGIYSNFTVSFGNDLPAFASYVASAIWRDSISPSGDLTWVGGKGFPRIETVNDFDIISFIGTTIFIFIFQLLLPVFITNIVYEKEQSLKEIMSVMGLKSGIYWIVTYFFSLFLYLLALLLIYIFAFAFSFRIFTENEFLTHFILFIIWGNTMIAMAIFMSVFFTKTLTATVLGYIVVFGSGILATELVDDFLANEGTSEIIIFLMSCYPPFALYRGLVGLSNGVRFGGPGMKFSEISGKYYELQQVYIFLLVEWAVLMVVGLYFEFVLPLGPGNKKHPCFCFPKSCREKKKLRPQDGYAEKHDVEAERILAESPATKKAVRITNLRKTYGKFTAVENLSMTIGATECFGFLGPNGAGKTTTLNMLSGFLRPSFGTANISGLDLIDDIDYIHLTLGVCPQDNVLWDNLTGPEHLRFYGRLKGLDGDELEIEVTYWLGQVNLLDATNKYSSQYSGGMKRRLCVAIAMIGNPTVVLLDEPTTGLDPASKRSLWEVINRQKKKCSILLTTHSMEEAEALCDRLGIFIRGRLSTLGSPSDLKLRYGKGYKLTITTKMRFTRKATKKILAEIPGSVLINRPIAGTQSFSVPRGSCKISDLFKVIQDTKDELKILDWGITNSTLEEVFLYIVDKEYAGQPVDSNSSIDV